MKKTILEQDCFVVIHGTSPKDIESILETGLYYNTAVLSSHTYAMQDEDGFLYTKLLNWQHHEAKGLIIISLPIECCGGKNPKPLWNVNKDIKDRPDYVLKPEFIYAAIDVNKKQIIKNPRYKRDHQYSEIDEVDELPINPCFKVEEAKEIQNSNNIESQNPSSPEDNKLNQLFMELFEIANEKSKEEQYRECIDNLNAFLESYEIFTETWGNYPLSTFENGRRLKEISQELKQISSTKKTL